MNETRRDVPIDRLAADRPRRWPYLLAGSVGLVALVVLLASGGEDGRYGARAGRYALSGDDLAVVAGSAAGSWVPSEGPVDFGRVFSAAQALPGVAAPDDRHVAAFRAPDGSADVFQVTVLYDVADKAEALVNSGAVASLSGAFGLSHTAVEVAGADDALRWSGSGIDALSFRRGGAVVFVGTRGTGAPAVEELAAAVLERLMASPPATSTHSAP